MAAESCTRGFYAKLLDWASPVASMEDAVRRLAKHGNHRSTKVGIGGFSHGEEIAGYAVSHTDVFRVATAQHITIHAFIFSEVTNGMMFSRVGARRMAPG